MQTSSATIIPHEKQMSNKIFACLKFFMKVCFLHMLYRNICISREKKAAWRAAFSANQKPIFIKRSKYTASVGADDSVGSLEAVLFPETQGESVCASQHVCRGRCPHRPGRAHRFYENLRRIRNCLTGRCGHRPLQSKRKARTNSPQNSSQRLYSVRADRVVRPYRQAGSAVS